MCTWKDRIQFRSNAADVNADRILERRSAQTRSSNSRDKLLIYHQVDEMRRD